MLSDKQFWEQVIKEALLNKAEYKDLDFKLKLSDKNDRFKEHVNAFGNLERGGCFVFGVDNFSIVGVGEDWDEIIRKVTSIADKSQEPNLIVDAFSLEVQNKNLLCIHVHSGKSKPVFIKDRAPLGGKACFKRSGSSTIAMSAQEIKDLLILSTANYYDESIVSEAGLEDLDFTLLSSQLPLLDDTSPWSDKNIAILKDYQIVVGENSHSKITMAGWLSFAKDPQRIRQFRNAYIEFQIFKGKARDVPIKKYVITGNIPSQIEQVITLLNQHVWYLPKIQGLKREDIPAYQEGDFREVITNCLVHCDYSKLQQPIKIAMFENRIEFENPGGLMPGLTILNMIHKRDWRNPLLAELMKKFGFGEMDGQGIDRLYAATLRVKVPAPTFINNEKSFVTILSAPKSYVEFTPEEKRWMITVLAIMEESIDNQSIRNCFGINSEKASTLIQAMINDNILEANSRSRKYAKYVLTESYREKVFG